MRMWLFALVLVGCATVQQPAAQKGAESAGDAVTDMNSEPLTGDAPGGSGSGKKDAATAPQSSVLSRSEVDAVLAQSPGYFLQHVETRPQFQGGHFHGWRLVSFFPGDPRFAGVDLQAGDVVTRVNGHPIEQPDQFMAVWTALRSSQELVVDVERDGAPRTLRWQIRDQ
jgi:type II secretory pathway component PulC